MASSHRDPMKPQDSSHHAVARAVRAVALANLAYFGVEFAVATAIGSVSLFADSVDFLEDAAVNALILLGLRWPRHMRARLGMALALILLLPGIATLWTAWHSWRSGHVPAPLPLSITGLSRRLRSCQPATTSLRTSRSLRRAASRPLSLRRGRT